MIEFLFHAVGICPDAHSHLDLLDLCFGGVASWGVAVGFLRGMVKRRGEDRP